MASRGGLKEKRKTLDYGEEKGGASQVSTEK